MPKQEKEVSVRSERLAWLDGMRGLSILWIVFVHFVAVFTFNHNVVFAGFWGTLLYGVSGKLAVAGCCVILGYFASKPSRVSVWRYSLRRYFGFVLPVLLMELIQLSIARVPSLSWYARQSVPELAWPFSQQLPLLLEDVFLFKARLIPTYWCVDDFVLGSIITFALHRWTEKWSFVVRSLICLLAIAGMIALREIWIAICLMGWLFRLMTECRVPFSKNPVFQIALLAAALFMIRRGESPRTYLFDGAASVIVLYVFSQCGGMRKTLSFRPLAWLGSITFELFLVHVPLFWLFRALLDELVDRPLSTLCYGILFACMFALAVLMAALWRKVARLLSVKTRFTPRKSRA